MKLKTSAFAAALVALAGPVFAQTPDAISVEDAYLRSASQKSGAAFMRIENSSDQDCRLIAATTPAANKAELHTHIEEDGIMKMVAVEEGFLVPAHDSFLLDRGGAHVMLMGLTGPLEQDDDAEMSLDFGDCGQVDLTIAVDNDRRPGEGGHDDHDHDHEDDDDHDSH